MIDRNDNTIYYGYFIELDNRYNGLRIIYNFLNKTRTIMDYKY